MSNRTSEPAIKIENLQIDRGGQSIVRDMTLTLQHGSLVGLVGPNGAGKSTLLAAMAGLLEPRTGTILYADDQTPIAQLNPAQRAARLGYLPQMRPVHWQMPVIEIVRLGRFAWGGTLSSANTDPQTLTIIEGAMARAGVTQFSERVMDSLSGGEQARVHLARLLAGQAPVLLADEPTSALDPAHQFMVMQTLRRYSDDGNLVVAALHDLALAARYCDRVIVLNDRTIGGDGAPEAVLTPELLATVFGVSGRFIKGSAETGSELILGPLEAG